MNLPFSRQNATGESFAQKLESCVGTNVPEGSLWIWFQGFDHKIPERTIVTKIFDTSRNCIPKLTLLLLSFFVCVLNFTLFHTSVSVAVFLHWSTANANRFQSRTMCWSSPQFGCCSKFSNFLERLSNEAQSSSLMNGI